MLAHVQPGVHQDFQVLFCRAALQLGSSQPAMVHMVPPQVQDFALCLVEHSEILVSLLSSLLKSLWMATWPSYHIHSSQFGVIHKLAEGIHCSIIYISKILNRTGLNIDPWEKPLGTGLQLDFVTDLPALGPVIQAVLSLLQGLLIQSISFSMRMLWDTMGKALLETRWTIFTALPSRSDFIVGHYIDRVWLPLGKFED